ncbi:unnamed protein product [Coregonus sp. 'balchen']|nr:unnamed protein product [Coregonus sp. 'balchen']
MEDARLAQSIERGDQYSKGLHIQLYLYPCLTLTLTVTTVGVQYITAGWFHPYISSVRVAGPLLLCGSCPPPAWTLSPLPCWCSCTRLCWPRMMWQCHVSSSECRCYRLNGFSLLKRFPLSADGACSKALDQPVGEWLEHVGLPQYESKLLLNGFDDLRYMGSNVMEDTDLRDMGITDPGHRKKIIHAARSLPKVKALGCDGSTSLSTWLDVLGLQEYLPNFLSSGYRTLDCVKNLWELEIVNVLKIVSLGHRKRIIASLAERPYEEAPTKSQISHRTSPLSQMDPSTSRSMDMLLPLGEAGRRRRAMDQDCSISLRSYSERPRSHDRQSDRHREPRLTLRPPSQSATYTTVSAWHHQPEKLILESCGYEASKSKDHSRKGPVVILSITYKGVKFIDAATKPSMRSGTSPVRPRTLMTSAPSPTSPRTTQTYEIILTLGQAFEVAYQLALQTKARQYVPVPPMSLGSEGAPPLECRCCYCHTCTTHRPSFLPLHSVSPGVQIDPLEMDADMQSLGSATWLFNQRDSNKRPVSTNSLQHSSFRTPSCELKWSSQCECLRVCRLEPERLTGIHAEGL